MNRRVRGVKTSQVPKGPLIMGRKIGAGPGDVQFLTLADLTGLGVATHQVAAAFANSAAKNYIQEQGIIITNSDGESVTN